MRGLSVRSAVGLAVLMVLSCADRAYAATVTFQGSPFFESSCLGLDAGNTQPNACVLGGGPYGYISGDLKFDSTDPADTTDYYAFHWNQTGNFSAVYATGTYSIYLALFNYVPGGIGALLKFDDADFVEYANLPAGNYVLGVSMNDFDPPYTIGIWNPSNLACLCDGPLNTFSGIEADGSVPEPATLLLVGTGVAAAATRARRRKA